MKVIILAPALLAASLSAQTPRPAPAAPAQGSVLDRAINTPGTNWSIYGPTQTSKLGQTEGVPGNETMRVNVTA